MKTYKDEIIGKIRSDLINDIPDNLVMALKDRLTLVVLERFLDWLKKEVEAQYAQGYDNGFNDGVASPVVTPDSPEAINRE